MKKYIFLLVLCSIVFAQMPADTLNRFVYEQKQIKINLNDAGKELKSARASFFIGILLGGIGTTLILTSDSTATTKFKMGMAINALGLISHFFSWIQIGRAGDKLQIEDR